MASRLLLHQDPSQPNLFSLRLAPCPPYISPRCAHPRPWLAFAPAHCVAAFSSTPAAPSRPIRPFHTIAFPHGPSPGSLSRPSANRIGPWTQRSAGAFNGCQPAFAPVESHRPFCRSLARLVFPSASTLSQHHASTSARPVSVGIFFFLGVPFFHFTHSSAEHLRSPRHLSKIQSNGGSKWTRSTNSSVHSRKFSTPRRRSRATRPAAATLVSQSPRMLPVVTLPRLGEPESS